VAGTLRVPGDKSISHRSLILSALANGESTIEGILDSEDVRSTAAVLRALGANIPPISQSMRVTGVGLRGLKPPREPLDCGNSGTTTRLMAGVVAAHPFSARSHYLKIRDRASYAFALVSVAAALELDAGGKIATARIALGGVAHKPWRAMPAEEALAGKSPSPAYANDRSRNTSTKFGRRASARSKSSIASR